MKGARIILGLACAALLAVMPVREEPVERAWAGTAAASAAPRERDPGARPIAPVRIDARGSHATGKAPLLVVGVGAARVESIECAAAGAGQAAAAPPVRFAGSRGGSPRSPPPSV